ncbi:MAG: hypothetical protein A4E28_01160 [Methanocella sp. PtaU1.Bin125]|nr:MAG: hypothetical protein A4E28_01160 [Methanocella sp. PtaU1.Bin125]
MACFNHPGMSAVAVCGNCGKECCAVCATRVGGGMFCRDCADFARSQLPPEPVGTAQEEPALPEPEAANPEGPRPETTAPAGPAPGPAVTGPSLMPVPFRPATMVPATPPSYPAIPDPGTGGPRQKESLLSAALSLVLPGAGQVYNGQIVKGVVLAVLYLGSMAAILVSIVLAAIIAPYICLFCLPAFLLPLIVLVYAIYDAYEAGEKINNGMPVDDWL